MVLNIEKPCGGPGPSQKTGFPGTSISYGSTHDRYGKQTFQKRVAKSGILGHELPKLDPCDGEQGFLISIQDWLVGRRATGF